MGRSGLLHLWLSCLLAAMLVQVANSFGVLDGTPYLLHGHGMEDFFSSSSISRSRSKREVAECGDKLTLSDGESYIIFSDNNRKAVKCRYKFKAPAGRSLSMSCPNFYLSVGGCKLEKMIVKNPGDGKDKFCRDSGPGSSYLSTSNKMIITHRRKKLKNKECSGGFVCIITVA